MTLIVDFQNQLSGISNFVPSEKSVNQWSQAVVADIKEDLEITVRITDEAEMTVLNNTYRGKNCPTNVLSFPVDLPEDVDLPLLGDIVICEPVVNREAVEQKKPAEAHWAHMVVHGTLHLLGYDHIEDHDAEEMENKEITILQQLGFKNPYLTTENK